MSRTSDHALSEGEEDYDRNLKPPSRKPLYSAHAPESVGSSPGIGGTRSVLREGDEPSSVLTSGAGRINSDTRPKQN